MFKKRESECPERLRARKVTSDPQLSDLLIILLSARAGEEAKVEGLNAGADDRVPAILEEAESDRGGHEVKMSINRMQRRG